MIIVCVNEFISFEMMVYVAEILDFCDFLSPTPEEQSARNAAIESVFDVIKYIWPNCKVFWVVPLSFLNFITKWRHVMIIALQAEVFGSFKTGLYLPTSDIDVSALLLVSAFYVFFFF